MTLSPKAFADEARKELNDGILDWWMSHGLDQENGGFIGEVDNQNNQVPTAEKGSVLNARILWTFSSAYRIEKLEKYKEMADRAYAYLRDYFIDKEFGGIYWLLDCKGNPVDTKKQVYAQAFALYGLSEYCRIDPNPEARELCDQFFGVIEKFTYDPTNGGYFESYTREWKLMEEQRLSVKDEADPKSMNTHLHIMEAYANYYRVTPSQKLADRIRHLLELFEKHIIDSKTGNFSLFFSEKWDKTSPIVSFGHDIEGSWLLMEAAEVIEDEAWIDRITAPAMRLADETVARGLDADGSLFYEQIGLDGHLDDDKHWWPQIEAVVGLINAWQVSDNPAYYEHAVGLWTFIKKNIIDSQYGEWFFLVSREGEPILDKEPKAGFWKCPYHNSRGCMELIERLEKLES